MAQLELQAKSMTARISLILQNASATALERPVHPHQ